MPHLAPLRREALAEFEPFFQMVEGTMGFVPNSLYTMGLRPDILRAFSVLAGTVLAAGTVDPGLKQLVAHVASTAAGCRYCQAHTAAHAGRLGIVAEKVEAVWEFERSPLFGERERAALRLARDAAVVPNAATAEHFESLRRHFSEVEIVELVAMISFFGWLNRWNDTLATELESEPLAFASTHLRTAGWQPGKHASGQR